MATRTKEQTIIWLKTAQKRQQDWQLEVKNRWASNEQTQRNVAL